MFALCCDGDLEEGVSHEAASLAGHLGLGRLVYVYDDNHITIDGPTELVVQRRRARSASRATAGTSCELGEVANDLDAIEAGIREGMAEAERPSLVILRSHIGWPSPKYTDTAHAHGSPLGADEVAAVKEILGLPPDDFYVPDDVLAYYRDAGHARSRRRASTWEQRRAGVPRRRARARRRVRRVPRAARASRAGRRSSRRGAPGEDGRHAARVRARSLDAVLDVVPGLVAGGADLTGTPARSSTDAPVDRHPRLRRPPDALGHPRARHGLRS